MRPAVRPLALAAVLLPGLLPAGAAATSPDPSISASAAPSPVASPQASPTPIARLAYEVVRRMPHDTTAWTEGFVFDEEGRLYESTGINGRSQVRELDPVTGEVLRFVASPGATYGEGLALVGDTFLQLTWKEGRAFLVDRATFEVVGEHDYAGQGEGWGLCYDGARLVMSHGSDTLTFRDPATFEVLGTVAVTADGQPLARLNELECVDGDVWANVWETEFIVRIDPGSGAVTGVLDADGLLEPDPAESDRGAVLNGIAKVPGSDTFLLTGKLWPEAIEVRITEP
jgi:glutamine cyclotransferase